MVSTVSFGIARTYHTIFSFFPCHFRSLHSFFISVLILSLLDGYLYDTVRGGEEGRIHVPLPRRGPGP